MKSLTLILLIILTFANVIAQVDKNGNPVFNSIQISEEKFENFELTTSYYSIKENISNKQSSVFVNEDPSLTDYLKFSRDLPSYYFIVHKESNVIAMIMLVQKNDGSKTTLTYNVINPKNGNSVDIPCNIWGEISEKRVEELEKIKIDKSSKILTIPNGNLYVFNEIAYRIQPFNKLKLEVIEMAKILVKD